jgi:MFS family permease
LTSLTFEIPTGALADLWGRKASIILGRISSLISTLLMISSGSFWGFAIAFAFSALSYTLNSGAADSLTYDSLKELKREGEYKKIYGSLYAIGEVGQSFAVILGGYLASSSFLYAYSGTFIVEAITLTISLWFMEPQIREARENRKSLAAQLMESAEVIKLKPLVLYLILFFGLLSALGATVYFYCQKFFEEMNLSKTLIAVIFTLDNLTNAVSSKFAYKLEEKINQRGVVILLPLLTTATLLGLGFSNWPMVLVFFYINSLITGFGYPIFSDYINSLIPSEYRATILSMDSASFSLFMIIFFPIVGYLGDNLGLSKAFILISVIFIPVVIGLMYKIRKHK